jgi:hypothetical protein
MSALNQCAVQCSAVQLVYLDTVCIRWTRPISNICVTHRCIAASLHHWLHPVRWDQCITASRPMGSTQPPVYRKRPNAALNARKHLSYDILAYKTFQLT